MAAPQLDTFTQAYIECALWSSVGDGEPGEITDDHCVSDLAPETLAAMVADCEAFQAAHDADIADSLGDWSLAGHDFWLTRCGHGAGFWDGDWPEPQADRLDKGSNAFGNVDLYVGDDGLIYA